MLDFAQVAPQVAQFSLDYARTTGALRHALAEAESRLRRSAPSWETVAAKAATSHTSWLMPEWHGQPDTAVAAPVAPSSYTALAVDGSQIVADRHDLALCFLINIGTVALRYGERSEASLRSRPDLAAPDESLLSDFPGDEEPIAPKRLAMHRALREMAALADLVVDEGRSAPTPSVAMCDGSLILWPLETERSAEYRTSVLERFQSSLDTARAARVPVASYVSRPMSRDVVNSLRIAACPFDQADCERNCRASTRPRPELVAPPCAGTERVTDAMLFGGMLRPGDRSAVFRSGSRILNQYDPPNRIAFFYLNAGPEIARVEVPAWVADDAGLLDLTLAAVYDQARKGGGYPVALAEAHELAIVRGADREALFRLMERQFAPAGLPIGTSQKALAKRLRRI